MSVVGILLLALAGLAAWLILSYNSLVGGRNNVDNSWSQIDVQLKRRHHIIPNMVETAKGYMVHERETLESVVRARAAAVQAGTVEAKSLSESALDGALDRFMLVTENYPDLKANQNFLARQEELTATENQIAVARQAYNDAVLGFNNKLRIFPGSLVAGRSSFTARQYLQLENPAEKEIPEVSFES